MTTPENTSAEPIGWDVLAFAAPEPTDWVDHSRSGPVTVAPVRRLAAWRGERGERDAAAYRLARPSPTPI